MELRDYQLKTIELCKKAYIEGHRKILVALPTGAGKTEIFMHQAKGALAKKRRVLVLVRRKSIVSQTLKRLEKATGTDIGLVMAKGTRNPELPCCVASIDTVSRRLHSNDVKNWIQSFDLVIVDEAHDATSESYQNVLGFIVNKKVSVLGYTATPYRIGRKGHTWWDCCVKPVTAAELRDAGYLAPITIYSPAHIDTQHVSIRRGEFSNTELYQTVNQRKIYGKIVETYEKLAKGKSALVFCVNKEHSRRVCEAFKQAGYASEHCDCGNTIHERQRVLNYIKNQSMHSNKPFILCNVNIFSTGIDIPSVEVVIQARPTASKVLYIQQVGRALRTFNGKSRALLIDHGANALRFGSPYDDHEPELTDINRVPRQSVERQLGYRCQACGYYSSTAPDVCPGCGHKRAEDAIIPKEVDDPLTLFKCDLTGKFKKELYFIQEALYNKGKSPDFAYYVLHKKHGATVIDYLPELNCPDVIRRQIEKRQLGRDRAAQATRQNIKTQLYS